ncbi:MAG: L-sorbosone dehydrogenase [Parcubacteria group bacterium GW2011_GWC1_39_29]|uniref:Pyrroloquinoline quinone-dependent pyranose dehydrogenase beta-propeller domain-containing protein n=1 Tax=Candidatus Yanofskybacteria bacterium GW2011_GWD1_39_16 TaxID=1619030 RepID=A0A837HPP5_9BACT|nr:MAG: hypothetical protein UT35_C0010G0003 [Candidatus Yanofskybacteria bacterium GW2011_GWD1_39_16]KKR14849.1 MAG: L-sorbosone dehydrogenase [Parcubacteria group bacterium GW2011_GWC1_39_29]
MNRKLSAAIILVILIGGFVLIKYKRTPISKIENPILTSDYSIDQYATNLDGPRVMEFDAKGRMIISETKAGKIIIVEDKNKNGMIEDQEKAVLLSNLKSPHGLAFYTDKKTSITYIYVAETQQVNRYVYDVNAGVVAGKGENIAKFPEGGRHYTRTISFGPNLRKSPIISGNGAVDTLSETKLYISVGSSCDACVEDSWKRATILESDPEGNFLAEFAGGLRNSVFFTFNLDTKELWATEMGRDNLGDNLPPDEINIIKAPDKNEQFGAKRYGWPFCYGNKVKDATFNPGTYTRKDLSEDCSTTIAPAIEIPAHSAPLGLIFVKSDKFPKDWQGDLLVAYHGSWNRNEKIGYKIARFKKDADDKYQYAGDLVSGWLKDGVVSGRPVDLKFGPDGSLYVSDDYSGTVYKITYLR